MITHFVYVCNAKVLSLHFLDAMQCNAESAWSLGSTYSNIQMYAQPLAHSMTRSSVLLWEFLENFNMNGIILIRNMLGETYIFLYFYSHINLFLPQLLCIVLLDALWWPMSLRVFLNLLTVNAIESPTLWVNIHISPHNLNYLFFFFFPVIHCATGIISRSRIQGFKTLAANLRLCID